MSSGRHFTPALFAFLRELAAHNDRAWFQRHQKRYEAAVREPALQFIRDFDPHLASISPHFRADDRRSGGSLFRIHRDVRFSKDKRPYKTYTGIQFRHAAGKDAHAPGFYLHLEPRSVFVGCGTWRPDTGTAGKIRTAIADDPAGWRAIVEAPAFCDHWELAGDSLVRAPRGFPADHEAIDDLRRKDYIAVHRLTQGAVTRAGFLDHIAALFQEGGPFMEFLCRAVEVPWSATASSMADTGHPPRDRRG